MNPISGNELSSVISSPVQLKEPSIVHTRDDEGLELEVRTGKDRREWQVITKIRIKGWEYSSWKFQISHPVSS